MRTSGALSQRLWELGSPAWLGTLTMVAAVALAASAPDAPARAPRWSSTAVVSPKGERSLAQSSRVAVDGRGGSAFVWSRLRKPNRGTNHDIGDGIRARVRGPGGGFGAAQTVTNLWDSDYQTAPDLAADGRGGGAIVWMNVEGSPAQVSERRPGRLFDAPRSLGYYSPAAPISLASSGALQLLTTRAGPPEDWQLFRHPAAGVFAAQPQELGTAPFPGYTPVAVGARGDVVLGNGYFFSGSGQAAPLEVSVRRPGGMFDAPEPIGDGGTIFGVAVAPDGSVAVSYARPDYTPMVAMWPAGSEHFSTRRLTPQGPYYGVQIAFTARNELIVAWNGGRAGAPTGTLGAVLWPAHRGFGPVHTLDTSTVRTAQALAIATPPDGSAMIGWSHRDRPRAALWTSIHRHGHAFDRATSVLSIHADRFSIAGGGGRYVAAVTSPFDESLRTRWRPAP